MSTFAEGNGERTVAVVISTLLTALVLARVGLLRPVLLHLLGLLLIILDLALWVLTLGPISTASEFIHARTVFAKPAEDVHINGDLPPSKVWRSVDAQADVSLSNSPFPECRTAYDLLCRAYHLYASQRAQGSRPLLGWRKDEGYRFPAKVFGATTWRTYAELGQQAHAFGSGLRALGAMPQPADVVAGADHGGVMLYEESSAEWMICAQGAFSQDIVAATAYASLGANSVLKAVQQGGCTVVICNRKCLTQVIEVLPNMPTVKAIVYTDVLCTPEDKALPLPEIPKPKGTMRNLLDKPVAPVKLVSFDEVIALGKEKPLEPTPPKPESVAVLMYTSGSTGDPKGVLITHANICAMVGAVRTQIPQLKDGGGEMYVGYLPLAHILELVSEMYYFATGNKIGYADPKSLMGGPERSYPHGALDEFKPTILVGVPKVWETIKAGALAKVEKAGPVAKFLISLAIRMKAMAKYQRRSTPVFNVLLKKFKQSTGGRLKATLSGGGGIAADVQEWVRTALDCPLVQGYGLTESCGGCVIQHPLDMSIGIAGTPLICNEVALHSEPDITDTDGKPYLATDTVHSTGEVCAGRGEVWIRGTNMSKGYYKMPELTRSEFGADGFFHTGDIGLLTPGGALKIIDRKKNLVKLKGGEYVALERMNSVYCTSPYVNVENGGVCCYADDSLDRPVAIAQCKPEMLTQAAVEAKVSFTDPSELCVNKEVVALVLKSFQATGKAAGLGSLEMVAGVRPVLEPWTTANGCLTATSKLVPKAVWKHQHKELDEVKPKGRK